MNIFSDISLWWSVPLLLVSGTLAFLYYRNQKQLEGVKSAVKWLLIALRTSVLFLLVLLLFGILIEDTVSKTENPVFITLIDNSSSVLNYSDSTKVKRVVDGFEKQLTSVYGDKFDQVTYVVDADVRKGVPDYKGSESNLYSGFEFVYNQYFNKNIGGICFISDGNFNKGNSPKYIAEKISLTPIFTVGIGDTVRKRDQMIRNVAANDIAFYRNQFPIEVDVEANKIGNEKTVLKLYQGSKLIESKEVQYKGNGFDFVHETFLVDANTIGFIDYTIELEQLDNESSYENNKRSIYVEVVDSRSKVLILSHAPHPDVAAFKSVLETDENLEVTSKLVNEWEGETKDAELLVLHGAGEERYGDLVSAFRKKQIPVLFFVGNGATKAAITNLGLGISIPSGKRTDAVQASVKTGFSLFEISDDVIDVLKKSPPISVKFGETRVENGDILLSQRIGNVVKKDPILFFGKKDAWKYGVVLGEGFWKWKLNEFAKTGAADGFNELFQKTVQYLVVKRNTEPLRINLPKRFTVNDDVIINAEFYNSSLAQITIPDINFEFTDADGNSTPYVFAKNETDYQLALGKLKAGKYLWSASASFNGKKYAKKGVFVVEDISIEDLSSSANHGLLQSIASQSDGQFYSISEMDKLIQDIGNRKDIVTLSYEESDYSDLIDWKWIAMLVVLLLSSEWFIRRYTGAY